MNQTVEPIAEPSATPPPIGQLDPAATQPLTVIEPKSAWAVADFGELWRARELLYYLTLRDIKLRYKQTILGFGWALFQPISMVIVFAVFIGWMGGAAKGEDPVAYVLFVLSGVLPWTFFATGATTAANSLVANERLVTKTYFPRLLLPMSCVGAAMFDFLIGLVLLAGWAAFAGVSLTGWLLFTPVVVLLLAMTSTGIGVLGSALIAAQRDFRHLIQFGMQLWMFATPCIYLRPEKYPFGESVRDWMAVNPAYGLILNFRNCVLGEPMDWPALAISSAIGLALLLVGVVYFHRVERTMADTI